MGSAPPVLEAEDVAELQQEDDSDEAPLRSSEELVAVVTPFESKDYKQNWTAIERQLQFPEEGRLAGGDCEGAESFELVEKLITTTETCGTTQAETKPRQPKTKLKKKVGK